MKSQMDWIVTIVSLVLALIAAGVCFAMKPTPLTPAEPESVETKAPEFPAGSVTFANSLSGGGGRGAAGGAQRGLGSGAPSFPGGAGGPGGPRGGFGPGAGSFGPPAQALQGAKGRAFAGGGPAMVGPGGGGGARGGGGGGGGKAGPKE